MEAGLSEIKKLWEEGNHRMTRKRTEEILKQLRSITFLTQEIGAYAARFDAIAQDKINSDA